MTLAQIFLLSAFPLTMMGVMYYRIMRMSFLLKRQAHDLDSMQMDLSALLLLHRGASLKRSRDEIDLKT